MRTAITERGGFGFVGVGRCSRTSSRTWESGQRVRRLTVATMTGTIPRATVVGRHARSKMQTEEDGELFTDPSAAKLPLARRIREFLETLFTSKLVVQLHADLDEARKQRDYFKGRAERLELLLTQPRVANRDLAPGPQAGSPTTPRAHPVVGGRKTWATLVAERRKELNDKAREAELAKSKGKTAATSAPVPPAQN